MERIYGVVTGIVDDVSDPIGMGRVRVRLPWLGADATSDWARVAAPMAGGKRGVYLPPEIGDEVLIAFEQGDVQRPYVVGFLWNGSDAIPRDNTKIRVIESVTGHVVELDDDAGVVTIRNASDHSIVMDDNGITLTVGGSSIEMTSSNITIKSAGIDLNP